MLGTWAPVATTPAGSFAADPQLADWRALLWFTVWLACEFSTSTTKLSPSGDLVVMGPPYAQPDADRLRCIAALLRTVTHLYYPVAKSAKAPTAGGPGMLYTQVATEGDAPGYTTLGESAKDVGALPAVVWIVGTLAVTAVIVYLGEKSAEVVDRELARREQSKRMVAFHGSLASLLAAHRQVEVEANGGKPLPLTDAERAALAALEKAQAEQLAALKADPGLSSIIPNMKNEGGTIVKTAGRLASTGLIVVGFIIVAALLSGAKKGTV